MLVFALFPITVGARKLHWPGVVVVMDTLKTNRKKGMHLVAMMCVRNLDVIEFLRRYINNRSDTYPVIFEATPSLSPLGQRV